MSLLYLEKFFSEFENTLVNLTHKVNKKCEHVVTEIQHKLTLYKAHSEINSMRQHVLDTLTKDLRSQMTNTRVDRLPTFTPGIMNLSEFLTNRLTYMHGFDSFQKVKYINILKQSEYNYKHLLHEHHETYYILSVLLIGTNKVFAYAVCQTGIMNDMMQISLLNNEEPTVITVLVKKFVPIRKINRSNFCLLGESLVIIHQNERNSFELEIYDTELNLVSSKTLQVTGNLSTTRLLSNTREIIVDLKREHLIYTSDLQLKETLGQNSNGSAPFYTDSVEDSCFRELIYVGDQKIFYKLLVMSKIYVKIVSRQTGLVLSLVEVPFSNSFNHSLDSILVGDAESRFIFKSFSSNNIVLFDFECEKTFIASDSVDSGSKAKLLVYNKIRTNQNLSYRIVLRDMTFKKLENMILFVRSNAVFQIRNIFCI